MPPPPPRLLVVHPDRSYRERLSAALRASHPSRVHHASPATALTRLRARERAFETIVLGPGSLEAEGVELLRLLAERGRAARAVITLDGERGTLLMRPRLLEVAPGADPERVEILAERILDLLDEAGPPAPTTPLPRRVVDYLSSNPDIVFRIGADGTYLEVTTLKPELLLVPEERLVGSTVEDVLPPHLAGVFQERIRRTVETGLPTDVEYRLLLDEPRFFEARLVPAGQAEVMVIVRDITEARQGLLELERRERFLRLVNLQVPAVLWTTDAELCFTSSSGSGLTSLSLLPDEVVGAYLHEFFGTADPRFPPILAHLKALGGTSNSFDILWAGVEFACHVEPLVDEGGEIVGTIGIALDVTERNRISRALEEREALLRQAQEVARMGSWTWDLVTDRLELSDPLLDLYGRTHAEFDGRPEEVLEWVHPGDRARLAEDVRAIREDGQPRQASFRIIRPDGDHRVFHVRAVCLDAPKMLGIVIDVTDRERRERALLESERQLRNLTGRLQRAQELERRAVAREVHDIFGQALTSARIDVVWLRRHLPEKAAELVPRLEQLVETIEQLLDTARDLTERLRPTVLDELGLEAAILWLVGKLEERTELVFSTALPREPLVLDELRSTALFRILQEALTNVIRHAGAQRVRVRLTESADEVVLTVVDDGRGIAPEAARGSGAIGLIGMSERARALGGSTRVRPMPRGGTEVLARIPRTGGDSQ